MIYPPILQSTQPAFLESVSAYNITFTLQDMMKEEQIGHVQIRIVYQSNNSDVIKTGDGVLYKNWSAVDKSQKPKYSIPILSSEVGRWKAGTKYKVQLRFGTTPKYTSNSNFAAWKQEQIDNQTFSEWSTVMVIKPITAPEVIIANSQSLGDKEEIYASEKLEASLNPLISASCSWKEDDPSGEFEESYRFNLYEGQVVDENKLIETSGWLTHKNERDENGHIIYIPDYFRFKRSLTNYENYTVTYEIITQNGFQMQADPYSFIASRAYYGELSGVTMKIQDKEPYNQDNGCITIYLTTATTFSGVLVLTRASEKTNFTVWENLKYLSFNNEDLKNALVYTDFTIESGVRYKYAIQQENSNGLRTAPVYGDQNTPYSVDFDCAFLYRNGVQLKLLYNQTMNSFKHTTLTGKQDTLGDKYPHLVKNGNAYYAEFPLNALISFQMDADQTFFTLGNDGFYYKDELVVPLDKMPEEQQTRTIDGSAEISDKRRMIDANLTANNVYVERKFREKVEEFLNDFDYKLFRSPTEGNIVVGLLNISLSPNATLGRMLSSVTATAYEVAEGTLEELNEFNIIDVGEYSSDISHGEATLSFGQIAVVEGPANIAELIRQQEEVQLPGGYKTTVRVIDAISVDRFPSIDFTGQITELEAERALANNEEEIAEIEEQIRYYQNFQEKLKRPSGYPARIQVDNAQIMMLPGRVYNVKNAQGISVPAGQYPLLINYVCENNIELDTSMGQVASVDSARIWGQISGIFTGIDSMIKVYNYDYGPGQIPLKVAYPDQQVPSFDVYDTINLLDCVEEETRKQIEILYEVNGKFEKDESGRWVKDGLYYDFSDVIMFDIEVDPGTIIYISPNKDGTNQTEIIVGPTGRYVLNPMDSLVKWVALKEPQFCLINFKSLTTQTRMG